MPAWGAPKEDSALATLTGQIRSLTKEVAGLRGERDAQQGLRDLTDERNDLTARIERLKIEKDRTDETNRRERREVEHMVGLEKKRMEQERILAVREAELKVKEDAVDAKVAALTEQLDFSTKELGSQITYLKDDIIKQVFERLPIVEVNKTVRSRDE